MEEKVLMYKIVGNVSKQGIKIKCVSLQADEKPKTYDLGYESVGLVSRVKKDKLGDNFSVVLEKLDHYKYVTIFDSRLTTKEEAVEFVKQKLIEWQDKAIQEFNTYIANRNLYEYNEIEIEQ